MSVSVRPRHPNEFQLFQPIVGGVAFISADCFPTIGELSLPVPSLALVEAGTENPAVGTDPRSWRSMLGATDVGTAEVTVVSPSKRKASATGRQDRRGAPDHPICIRRPTRSCVIKPGTSLSRCQSHRGPGTSARAS